MCISSDFFCHVSVKNFDGCLQCEIAIWSQFRQNMLLNAKPCLLVTFASPQDPVSRWLHFALLTYRLLKGLRSAISVFLHNTTSTYVSRSCRIVGYLPFSRYTLATLRPVKWSTSCILVNSSYNEHEQVDRNSRFCFALIQMWCLPPL